MKSLCAVQTNDPKNFNTLGCLLLKTGQLDGAIHAFQTALKLAPNTPAVQANLADALRLRQQQEFLHSPTHVAGTGQGPAR